MQNKMQEIKILETELYVNINIFKSSVGIVRNVVFYYWIFSNLAVLFLSRTQLPVVRRQFPFNSLILCFFVFT